MTRYEIAGVIEFNINRMVDDWVVAVRDNGTVLSSLDLSDGGLRDHVPQVLEEIAGHLRMNAVPSVYNTREARVSAYSRYAQNYRITELITEIALLRRIIFNHLSASLREQSSTPDLQEYSNVVTIINAYLDEEMRYGSAIFCESIKRD